ncbi:LIM and SH3 domain protein 1-like isoform X11 [Amphiura filiformis]|uniref:LIM and SH3 domain protein 1-like isoform X11 n=1 Tax=Amphiura filiformis TaxID=82378 RepID=UPI003B218C60
MNPPCAFCKKTVYPTEKFNCLDKIWHKGCFKCTECSLKLTMSTYKGFNKMPYCNAHYPKLKATQVAQTAEQTRLKKISNQQSQVLYHKDFNQAKGAKISVVDDPALKTQRAASQNQSLAAYHGLAQKKADQEMRRPAQEDEPEQGYRRQSGGYQPPPQATRQQQPLPPVQPAYNYEPEPEPEPPAAPQVDYEPEPQYQPEQSGGGGGGGGDLKRFKALYDYTADDADEVTFVEDDIFEGTIIDEGWIEGTVCSTGQYGMAPRNYFEEC